MTDKATPKLTAEELAHEIRAYHAGVIQMPQLLECVNAILDPPKPELPEVELCLGLHKAEDGLFTYWLLHRGFAWSLIFDGHNKGHLRLGSISFPVGELDIRPVESKAPAPDREETTDGWVVEIDSGECTITDPQGDTAHRSATHAMTGIHLAGVLSELRSKLSVKPTAPSDLMERAANAIEYLSGQTSHPGGRIVPKKLAAELRKHSDPIAFTAVELKEAALSGYRAGHQHTVDGSYQWCQEGGDEVTEEIVAELRGAEG